MEITNESNGARKTCTKCKQEQPVAEFSKRKAPRFGHYTTCRKCVRANGKVWYKANEDKCAAQGKEYREANPEKVKEWSRSNYEASREKLKAYSSAHYKANKDKRVAQGKAWREANPEKNAAQSKAWREANREKIAAQKKEYNEANKEKIAARGKTYREANPEKIAARRKSYYKTNRGFLEMRRIIGRANRGDIPSLEIYGLPDRESVKQVRIGKLAIYKKHFGKKKYHLDHMQPLAGAKGDTEELHRRSHFTNLIYIPAKINLSKHAKPFWEWYMSLEPGPLKRCIIQQANYNDMIVKQLSIKVVEDITPIDDQPKLGS